MHIKPIIRHKRIILIAFSLALFFIIIRIVGFNEIVNALKNVDKSTLTLAIALYALSIGIGTFRWKRIIGLTDTDPPISRLLQYVFIDKFANSFLPTSAAGMALRTILLEKEYCMNKTKGLATIVLDYGMDIFGTFLLAVPCFLFLNSELSTGLQNTFRTSLLTIAIISALVFIIGDSEYFIEHTNVEKRNKLINKIPWTKRIKETKIWKKFVEFSTTFSIIFANKRVFFETLVFTFAKVLLDALRITVLFYAFGISVPFYYFILFDSAWTFLAPLMFTPGGIGIVETGRIALYSLIPSISPGVITPVVFIDRLITFWLMTVLGAVVFFSEGINISMKDITSQKINSQR